MRRTLLLVPLLGTVLVGAARLGRRSGVTDDEVAAPLPGDGIVPDARVVIDRATTLAASPERVWPWIVQLGKRRAGWYFPRWIEVAMPRERRGLRHVEPRWQRLAVGDVIPDWGGPAATFEVAVLDPPNALVHRSTRERRDRDPIRISWAIVLTPVSTPTSTGTRLHLRLRISALGRRTPRLMTVFAGLIDEATVAPLFAGLAERLR
jgi:hypothetical protein